jgi:hypothetical protein
MERRDIEAVFRKNNLLEGLRAQGAVLVWQQVVDSSFASVAVASHVSRGTLHVTVASPTVANELHLNATRLIERINAQLKKKSIRRIRFEVGRLPEERPSARVEAIGEADAEASRVFADVEDTDVVEQFVGLFVAQRCREKSLLARGGVRCPNCGVVYVGTTSVCPGCRYDSIEADGESD